MSPIQDFYNDQTIFLTGATGFLGKLIIEKLLRTCDVKKFYLLVRPKYKKTLEQRFSDIFTSPCFDAVKSANPDFSKKICLLSGDCNLPMLGLTQEDMDIIKQEVTCVIHSAADVRFDTDLKNSVYTNVRSVRDLLDLATQMENLRSFVYVSTAFSHCYRKNIGEEFYDVNIIPNTVLRMVEAMDEATLEVITPQILGRWTNTYVYTKALAEEVIRNHKGNLPVAIVRPVIVISSLKEPFPGWIDNFPGVVGLILGCALGVIRSLHVNKKCTATIVPADFVVNTIIAAAWNVQNNKKEPKKEMIPIYNFTGQEGDTITWGWMMESFNKFTFVYPLSAAVRYSYYQITRFELLHKIRVFVYHTVFAYCVDFFLFLAGKKTLAVQKYRKINKLMTVLSYFAVKSWNFQNGNVRLLWDKLDENDKKVFYFNMKDLDWEKYLESCAVGGRLYLMKDPLETVPKARKKMYVLAAIHYAFIGLVIYFLFWILSTVFKIVL